ncbi:hypothetical protein POX_f07376 [Penicillium oxalicum]|uniref:hypothetical protein n=1 Tax=Penicillium oxalicum TaxID=69781 RepID=UPI0020B818EB|nr:hypothetical protein POX_f07376 [Penicillium oxalicum]KAI2787023.1 hypothetical protein POX_f07376 [Penicillium oxalicum]
MQAVTGLRDPVSSNTLRKFDGKESRLVQAGLNSAMQGASIGYVEECSVNLRKYNAIMLHQALVGLQWFGSPPRSNIDKGLRAKLAKYNVQDMANHVWLSLDISIGHGIRYQNQEAASSFICEPNLDGNAFPPSMRLE